MKGGNRAFHGGRLEPEIRTIRHALAKDERRFSYFPELYERVSGQDYQEKWFRGYHSDVGGGNAGGDNSAGSGRLSDVTLQWMMEEAGKQSLGTSKPDPNILPWNPDPKGIPRKSDWPQTWLIHRSRTHAYLSRKHLSSSRGAAD